jgi:integrase
VSLERITVQDGKWGKKRNIYLPEHFSIELQEYMKKTAGESEYLFSNDRKKWEKLWVGAISTIFKRISISSWLHVYPHLMRHSYA